MVPQLERKRFVQPNSKWVNLSFYSGTFRNQKPDRKQTQINKDRKLMSLIGS